MGEVPETQFPTHGIRIHTTALIYAHGSYCAPLFHPLCTRCLFWLLIAKYIHNITPISSDTHPLSLGSAIFTIAIAIVYASHSAIYSQSHPLPHRWVCITRSRTEQKLIETKYFLLPKSDAMLSYGYATASISCVRTQSS